MRNIARVLECKESDILNFQAINTGLTNTSFVFEVAGKRYVYRHPGDGTEAIISRKHEKKALELAPESAACLDTMGWVYYKMGLYYQARKYLEQAHKKDSRSDIIRQHLHEAEMVDK